MKMDDIDDEEAPRFDFEEDTARLVVFHTEANQFLIDTEDPNSLFI